MSKFRRVGNEEYPPGWSRERVEAIVRYHESRTDEEAAAEIETAEEAEAWMLVPRALVHEVEELIEAHERGEPSSTKR